MENSKGDFALEKILIAIIIIVLIIAGTVIFIYLNNNKNNMQQNSMSEQSSNKQSSSTIQEENNTTQNTSKNNSKTTQNTTNTQINQDKYSRFINEDITQQAYETCIEKIKSQLKNPASLQVVSKSYDYTYDTKEVSACRAKDINELRKIAKENELNEYYIMFDIDISAQNSFGGNARKDVDGCCKMTYENNKVYITCSIFGLDNY